MMVQKSREALAFHLIPRADHDARQALLVTGSFPSQDQLQTWYKCFDICCLCSTPQPVMHIRYRRDSDLYFLANNPSAPEHEKGCTLERKARESRYSDEPTLESELSTLPLNHEGKENQFSMRKMIELMYESSFANYFHGKHLTLESLVRNFQSSDFAGEATLPSGAPLSKALFYGKRGLVYARNFVQRGSGQFAAWFQLCDSVRENDNRIEVVLDNAVESFYTTQAGLSKAPGPYLLCVVFELSNTGRAWCTQILTIPVISKELLMPAHSEWHRESGKLLCSEFDKPKFGKGFVGFPFKKLTDREGDLPPIIVGSKQGGEKKRYICTPAMLNDSDRTIAEKRFNAIDTSLQVARSQLRMALK